VFDKCKLGESGKTSFWISIFAFFQHAQCYRVLRHYLFHIEAPIEVSSHVCQTKLCGGAHEKEDIIEMLNAMLQRPVED
jgi:hypothetical protein